MLAAATFENSAYLPIAVSTAVLPALAGLFPPGSVSHPGSIAAGGGRLYLAVRRPVLAPVLGAGAVVASGREQRAAPDVASDGTAPGPPPVIGVLLGYLFGLTPLHRALTPPARRCIPVPGGRRHRGLTVTSGEPGAGRDAGVAAGGRQVAWADIAVASGAKLALAPALGLGLLWLLRGWWRHDAALAVAAFVVFLAAHHAARDQFGRGDSAGAAKGDSPIAAQVIPKLLSVAYPLSLLTMPLWLLLFFHSAQRIELDAF